MMCWGRITPNGGKRHAVAFSVDISANQKVPPPPRQNQRHFSDFQCVAWYRGKCVPRPNARLLVQPYLPRASCIETLEVRATALVSPA